MTEMLLEAQGDVSCTHLGDGRIVRLAGAIGADQSAKLRLALLTPLPETCRDIVIDAGDVTALDDEPVAILLAAPVWARRHGARVMVSRTSRVVAQVIEEMGAAGELPQLQPLPSGTVIPLPRTV